MKKHLKLFSRSAAGLVTAGAICLAANAPAATEAPPSTEINTSGATAGTTSPTSPGTKDKKAAAEQNKQAAEARQTTAASGGASTGGIGAKDRAFVKTAAKGNQMEIDMGQMAQKQAQSAEVKRLGAQMVADHTRAATELKVLTHSRGITIDTRHKMEKLDSANFDQAWLAAMVRDHQKMIAEFQKESKTGMDADVKAFAMKQLPILQKHLKLVQEAQSKLSAATTEKSG